MALAASARGLELTAEGLVEEGLLQLRQRGELAVVEGGELLSFLADAIHRSDNSALILQAWQRYLHFLDHP